MSKTARRESPRSLADLRPGQSIDYLNGKVLGGCFRSGPFGGFGVPGVTVDAWYWMPLPPAPEVPALP
jgi:hypothetical protein